MMEERINRIFNECVEQLQKIDIPLGKVNKVVIVHDSMRWGRCTNLIDYYKIEIDSLLTDPKYEKGLRKVIMHELLHTCPNCITHNSEWKKLAKKVTEAYGCNIQVTDGYYDLGISTKDYVKYQQPKYAFYCIDCGTVVLKTRACHMTRHYILYRCSKCGGILLKMPEDKLRRMKGLPRNDNQAGKE